VRVPLAALILYLSPVLKGDKDLRPTPKEEALRLRYQEIITHLDNKIQKKRKALGIPSGFPLHEEDIKKTTKEVINNNLDLISELNQITPQISLQWRTRKAYGIPHGFPTGVKNGAVETLRLVYEKDSNGNYRRGAQERLILLKKFKESQNTQNKSK
tara:strand:- start:1083 stop:1553 length:471 start_codon:yes stop_codon:yes gene_type:complete